MHARVGLSAITCPAMCCQNFWMPGTHRTHCMKSMDILYNRRVCPGLLGRHTCNWCRWFLQASALWPLKILPGCASPMVDCTQHGGWKVMSMGYGSQLPPKYSAALNLTESGMGQPLANVVVWVKGAWAKSSKFSISKPCSTSTSTYRHTVCLESNAAWPTIQRW